MASAEHVTILKKGVDTWNEWRLKNPLVRPNLAKAELVSADLIGADLRNADLRGANLNGADLGDADLSKANLREADLTEANLHRVDLTEANMRSATLFNAELSQADLGKADLSGARLISADFTWANLTAANLSSAVLDYAKLTGADVAAMVLNKAHLRETVLGHVDMSEVVGLETVNHAAPSIIGIDTLFLSKGRIPDSFLRGAGVPETMIQYYRSLVIEPIQFYSCFISYSANDGDFARRLHADLHQRNVRIWFAPEDLRIGDRFRQRIDDAIRLYEKLLLVLSANSVNSKWVEKEVETAFRERAVKRNARLVPNYPGRRGLSHGPCLGGRH